MKANEYGSRVFEAQQYDSVDFGLTPTEQTKNDLLAMGIELDCDLIERMQNNLGASKAFQYASKAASVMKSRKEVGRVENIQYRNVTDSAETHLQTIRTFQDSLVQVDVGKIHSILKELNSRDSNIDPQTRAGIFKLIQNCRILFTRAPDKFLQIMLGRQRSESATMTQEHLFVKQRYLDETGFHNAILRLYPSANGEEIAVLFRILGGVHSSDDYGSRPKTEWMVDTWSFLTLLKTASEESRRSYDSKTSNVAHNVEFWSQKRAPFPNNMKQKVTSGATPSNIAINDIGRKFVDSGKKNHSVKSTLIRDRFGPGSRMGDGAGPMIRQAILPPAALSPEQVYKKSEMDRVYKEQQHDGASRLISQSPTRVSASVKNRGRVIFGEIQRERQNVDDVSAALNPQRDTAANTNRYFASTADVTPYEHPRRKAWDSVQKDLGHNEYGGKHAVTENDGNSSNRPKSAPRPVSLDRWATAQSKDGLAMAAALGQNDTGSGTRHRNRNSYCTLQSEGVNKTSVAAALGCNREDNIGRRTSNPTATSSSNFY